MATKRRLRNKRVSTIYSLGRTQPTLDFVDVDVSGDTPVFLSPRALTLLPSEWGDRCVFLVQNFFTTVLNLIKIGKNAEAESLLAVLKEPNETHLGLSKGRSRGRALGAGSAKDVWGALSRSAAARSGLLTDLEDTVLFVDGVGIDIISDMTTNIIRQQLISYTQEMSDYYGIELTDDVESGSLWNPDTKRWFTEFVRLPVTTEGKLLLVPKAIVRQSLQYDTGEYYRHYLLTHLQQAELNANSGLVELLKSGKRRVTKKAVQRKYGTGKKAIVREALRDPAAFVKYKKDKENATYLPLTLEQIAKAEGAPAPDFDALLAAVLSVPTGKNDATRYERNVEGLLSALFYPSLTNPRVQDKIHEGRKRIDITYTNTGVGFFQWLALHYAAASVFVECKNYGKEVGNPELDQLSGRFSPSRGKFGLLVCRSFEDKALFNRRCKDTALDDRGFIIPLDDDDLKLLVETRKTESLYEQWPLLMNRFRGLTN